MVEETDHYLPAHQAGFRKNRGSRDNIWILVFVGRFKEIREEGGGGGEGRGVLLYVYWYARSPGASSRFLVCSLARRVLYILLRSLAHRLVYRY